MPEWFAVVLLGIVEGVTEFLPVSSTGHLLLCEHWLKPRSELFNVVIQCGAVLAVTLVFMQRLRDMVRQWREPAVIDYAAKIAAAFLITAVGGLILKKIGLKLAGNSASLVATTTLVGGVLILIVERWLRGREAGGDVTWTVALAVATAQLLAAAFPGTSRSGATILVALALGLSRPRAAEFSFLLGIPTLLAAGAYEILSAARRHETSGENWGMVFLG